MDDKREYVDKEYCLRVRGPFACFTRPEMKVERVSYDVITPSAARAIFQAIFWKPAIRWEITKIEVLAPIKRFTIKRNELASIMSRGSKGVDISEDRRQRASYLLRDVDYRIYAKMVYIPLRELTVRSITKKSIQMLSGRRKIQRSTKQSSSGERERGNALLCLI